MSLPVASGPFQRRSNSPRGTARLIAPWSILPRATSWWMEQRGTLHHVACRRSKPPSTPAEVTSRGREPPSTRHSVISSRIDQCSIRPRGTSGRSARCAIRRPGPRGTFARRSNVSGVTSRRFARTRTCRPAPPPVLVQYSGPGQNTRCQCAPRPILRARSCCVQHPRRGVPNRVSWGAGPTTEGGPIGRRVRSDARMHTVAHSGGINPH